MLALAIRVASTLGSPVVNVKIGNVDDRCLAGGIQPRIGEAVRVLTVCKQRARDSGVRFGFENHAADVRSEELLAAIELVGTDDCGVMIDPGNALWAMEDPMGQVQSLAPHVVCNSLRDYMVWPKSQGATFQWMAVGEGLMDVPTYVQTLTAANPGMPIFVESISNSARRIPFLSEEYWKGYPSLKAKSIAAFLRLCRRGRENNVNVPPDGTDKREFDSAHQRAEFLRSIAYLRSSCAAGLKTAPPI